MSDQPKSLAEYNERFKANTRISGYGPELTIESPCPFCAHPGFATWHPAAGIFPGDERPDMHDEMRVETTCEACGRSGRTIVDRDEHGVGAEFVQTGGPDPPDWLDPAPRRVD